MKKILAALGVSLLSSCGTLDDKTININVSDTKQKVLAVMGVPQDRQMKDSQEAWQYCVSGAGFGYNDHKIIWINRGLVAGITSYRSSRSGCTGAIKTVNWEETPDLIVETRAR